VKILYVITKSNWGGAQRYVFDLATGSRAEGHDVAVAHGRAEGGGAGVLGQRLREAGIRTVPLAELERNVSAWKDFRSFMALAELLQKEQPDVLHLNSSKVGGIGALAGRWHNSKTRMRNLFRFDIKSLQGEDDGTKKDNPLTPTLSPEGRGGNIRRLTKIIFTGHGWAFTEERPDWQRVLIAGVHWVTIQLAHDTIAVSRKTREEVAQIPLTWHKMTVVHNGVGGTTLHSQDEARRVLLGERSKTLSNDTLVIGALAELHKNKGLSYALDGLALLKKQSQVPFRFVVIGEGEERFTLEKQRALLGLDEEVIFSGFHPRGAELLPAFDIFLFPSVKEGFPYAILEAGKAGIPVVATPAGGIPEVIDDMQSGILVQSKNPGEIARALKFLFENPERRKELGQKIAERIRNRFSVEEMVRKTLQLYEDES